MPPIFVRTSPDSRHEGDRLDDLRVPRNGREQAQQGAPTETSLDHVVGTGELGRRHVKAERLRGHDNTEARCCTSDGRW